MRELFSSDEGDGLTAALDNYAHSRFRHRLHTDFPQITRRYASRTVAGIRRPLRMKKEKDVFGFALCGLIWSVGFAEKRTANETRIPSARTIAFSLRQD